MISVIMFAMSIMVILAGIFQESKNLPSDAHSIVPSIELSQSGYTIPVVIMASTVFITAFLGCCLARAKNKMCLAVAYGFLVFILGTLLIIFGSVAIAAKSFLTPETFRDKVCSSTQAKAAGAAYAASVDKVMCSDICPCPYGNGN